MSQTKLKLPRLLGDGMVLQRNARVKIWGWAVPGETVTVRFLGEAFRTACGAQGEWALTISTGGAGGPYEMTVEAGDAADQITIRNILLGDVWLCSGQSNMEMKMESVKDTYPQEVARACNDAIRQIVIPVKFDFEKPQADIDAGTWVAVSPQSILGISAVGYFFAKKLFEQYHVPIGLVNASLGGAPAEAWMSEEALHQFPGHLEATRKLKDRDYIDAVQKADMAAMLQWHHDINQNDAGMPGGGLPWFDPAYDASAWPAINVPCYWEDEGVGSFNGAVWFRKEFDVPVALAGKPAKLIFGNIVDEDTVYLNGTKIGSLPMQYISRKYNIPQGVLKEGKNTIVVRVVSNTGKGGFYKGKPYHLDICGSIIDLAGRWQYAIGVKSPPMPEPTLFMWYPVGLYNGMVAPATSFAIKGVVWYQGESNAKRPGEYESLLKALIADWRKQWGQGDFPFLCVQLPNYEETLSQASGNWAQIREAQRRVALSVPHTALAVTIDIGEWNDVHPMNKRDVGFRLALAAQKAAYGEDVVASGPMLSSARREGNRIMLSFSEVGSGLVARGGGKPGHFAIAGADRQFLPAEAEIQGDCIAVWHSQVSNPVCVRYAWADNPEGANLYNREGLPASPFETEPLAQDL